MSLETIRKTIDDIDTEMRVLFERRMDCIKAVAEYKFSNDGNIFDQGREEKMMEKNTRLLENKEYLEEYGRFLQAVLDVSKDYQKKWILYKKAREGRQ